MIDNLKEIAEALSFFHNGILKNIVFDNGELKLKIEAPHLATLHQSDHTTFYITIFEVSDYYFTPWKFNQEHTKKLAYINKAECVILSADFNKFNYIEIQLEATNYIKQINDGGLLILKSKRLSIYDQEFNRLDYDYMFQLKRQHHQIQKQKLRRK